MNKKIKSTNHDMNYMDSALKTRKAYNVAPEVKSRTKPENFKLPGSNSIINDRCDI